MAQLAKDFDNSDDTGSSESSSGGAGGSRRGFLKAATVAIGGAIGAVLAYPVVRYVLYPIGRKTVSGAAEPIDVMADEDLAKGGAPLKVELVGAGVRNAWSVSESVALGSAWIRRRENGEVLALSATCPHLGCAISFDGESKEFKCPCHRSAFSLDGDKKTGPAKRGLDSLDTDVDDNGRLRVRFQRFKQDIAEKEPV